MLLFGPSPAALERLRAALPWIDAVQVRVKPRGLSASHAPAPARATHAWTLAVLALLRAERSDALLIVDDRVDVARTLAGEGVAGVHLGQDDLDVETARAQLGPELLIGLSTHDGRDLARAAALPLDYLGFGPVWSTPTKGYAEGRGPEAAWVAANAVRPRPVFAIGGVDATNADELEPVGRAAVGSAILAADDPAAAARAIREALGGEGGAGMRTSGPGD